MNDKHTLNIDAMTTQGEGIGRLDGKAVFIPFVLPGEQCEAVIIEQHKNYDRAMPVNVYSETPETIPYQKTQPACPVFGMCGGCQLQHVAYEDQRKLKRDWLIETFQRLVHIEVEPDEVAPSTPYGYRNKISLQIYEDDDGLQLGYNLMYQAGRFVAVEGCPIAQPEIEQAIVPLRDTLRQSHAILKKPGKNDDQKSKAVIRLQEGKVRILLENILLKPDDSQLIQTELIDRGIAAEVLYYTIGQNKSITPQRAAAEGYKPKEHHNSFMQVNDIIRETLYQYLLQLPYLSTELIVDGYCGTGILTARLAERFERVIGVESFAPASKDAEKRMADLNLSDRVEIHQRRLEPFLYKKGPHYPVLLLNPPRAGLSHEARKAVSSKKPDDLVMVSCHPAALARDVKYCVEQGYEIQSLKPFDMFPQTYHYEVVCHLQMKKTSV